MSNFLTMMVEGDMKNADKRFPELEDEFDQLALP